MLYSLTRPSMSDILPKETSKVAVTILYPKSIHNRYVKEFIGLMSTPRNIEGSAIITMLRSIAARRVPRVVLERAIHLYCVCYIIFPLEIQIFQDIRARLAPPQNKIKSFEKNPRVCEILL